VKKYIAVITFFLLFSHAFASETDGDTWTMQDDTVFYNSLTVTADYSQRPVFKPMAYTKHDLIEDIKVSAVESIPFGFMYTFAGLWLSKAIAGHTLNPKIGSLIENQKTYYIAIGAFMFVNVAVNIFTFYDYSRNTKEGKDEKNKTGP
jgi:hypothetical protein